MSNINLRLYGEQIYPNITKYITKYISPEIKKEEFLEKYKNGSVEIQDIILKEKIFPHPQIKIENASIGELKLHIPNETENFSMLLNDIKCLLILSDIKEEIIESMILENRKKLIDEFIKYSIAKIENKEGGSFLENIIKNFVNKIINGLSIEINNLELRVKMDNVKNSNFLFKIENIVYSDEKGIKINNISIIYEEDLIKINVIDKFNFIIDIIHSNEEGKPNKLNLTISDFKFEINKNIYFEFLNYFNIFDNANYKQIYLKYKKLILYHKPPPLNGKKDYKSLWYYAIKTIIKLQKYIKYDKPEIFDLLESSQIKIVKKYLENEKNDEKILLPDNKNCLIATREKVEKKVLENKKGNVLANAFSFFFSAKKEEKKEELTEEEKEKSEEIYQESNIIKYLNGNINENTNASLSSIFEKIKKFLENISVDINIEKLEIIIHNINIGNEQNIFIKGMRMNINYYNKEFDFKYSINDIGYEKDKSFFDANDLFCVNAIEFSRDKNNFVNLSFGFKNIELKEELFMCLITFFKSIQTKTKQKLFKEKKYKMEVKKEAHKDEKENEIMKNIKNFSFMNNFKLSNIPSFSIKSKDNKIEVKVVNYSMTDNSISFTINIKDSFGIILNDYTFNPINENNKFIFHMDTPMNIVLSNKSTKNFFLNYLRYKKELSNNNDKEKTNFLSNEEELFCFNYISYKNIDLGNIDINLYSLDISINKINIQIFEEEKNYQSSFIIDDLKFLYQQKKLNISLDKLIIKSNLMSTMILHFLDFESPLFIEYQKKISFKDGDINDIFVYSPKSDSDNNKNQDNNKDNLNIKSEFDYSKLLKDILNKFDFKLNVFSFIFQANDMTLSLNFINTISFKNNENNNLCFSFDKWFFDMESLKFQKRKLMENNFKTLIKYDPKTEIIKGKMKSVYFYTNLEEVVNIWDNLAFLLNQINWDIILCKMDFKIEDFALIFDQFKYSISNILFTNFKEGSNKCDAMYFKLLEFIMINKNNNAIKIIYEKELFIDYIFTSSIENDIYIKFSNVNIQISQHDILFLLLCIKLPKKEKKEEYQRFNSVMPEMKSNNKNNNNKDLLDFEELKDPTKEKNNMYRKSSVSDYQKQTRKKFSLTTNISIPKLNLCFCLNDYSKQSEFSFESSKIKVKSIFFENIFDHKVWNDLSYSFLLGTLNFKDFSNKECEYTILTKRKINLLENKNSILDDKDNKNEHNQVEIFSDNNGYTVNFNENEINVRFDSLLFIYYYFRGSIPIDEVIDNLEQIDLNKNNKKNNNFQFQINFNNSKFQLCTSFDGKENLFLDINNFIIIYNCSINGKLPYGNYMISLNQISANIVSKSSIRELFFTNNQFFSLKINFSEEIFSANIIMDTVTINLTYRDILSFLRVYTINFKKIKNAMKKGEEYLKNLELNKNEILMSSKGNNIIPITQTKKGDLVFTGEFNFEKFYITLIDNSKGSYHPFINIIIDKIYLVLNPGYSLESSFSFILLSYNYISCIWEPTIEKTSIKFNNSYSTGNIGINNQLKIDITSISINLSDMAISFTLLTFNNWLKKLEEKQKKFEDEEMKSLVNNKIKTEQQKSISKISNNRVINYTGMEMKIIHNGKEIQCLPFKNIELEYINEYNKSKKASKYITLVYDNEHKFEIPLEKIVTLRHIINNDLLIISDNTISENRSIDIHFYSPIIFKNKSIYPLQIKVENKKYGEIFLLLNPNSIIGLPLNFINKETNFNFMLINTKRDKNKKNENNENDNDNFSENFNLGPIINTNSEFKKPITFKNKSLVMKLDHKITNVRALIINTEYSIINCLPCNIVIHFSKKKALIKKCSQYFIDISSKEELYIRFSIEVNTSEFTSEGINILTLKNMDENNYIKFSYNKHNFNLKFFFKKNEEENTLIIYSEYVLYNNSGIELSIYSKLKEKQFIFPVEKNISLISSKNDYKEAKIQLFNDHFISRKIDFSTIIESTPYYIIKLQNNEKGDYFYLSIKKKFSYMSIINNPNFRENISSTVFTIFPSCRITNLLSTQRFFICDYQFRENYSIVGPLSRQYFHFYGRGQNAILGISVLNLNSNKCSHLIKFQFKNGIYTLSTGDFIFNLEIRKNPSDGCLDVFVIENSIDNSQILLENLTNEIIVIHQEGFDNYMQILQCNSIQTLKVFNYESQVFAIEGNDLYATITFNSNLEQQKIIRLNPKIVVLIQVNEMKTKVTFYLNDEFNKLKSKNYSITNYFNININSISISMIGDNEFQDKTLNNYERNELLLLIFNNIIFTINSEQTIGILDKTSISLNIVLNNFSINNQISKKGKFAQILHNTTPFLSLYDEIDYFTKFKSINIKKQDIIIGKLELGIDPKFFIDLINFFENILYRMNITNFNVHSIFKNQNKTEDKIYNELINEYNQSRILITANYFILPELNIKFELTNIGLKQLLRERLDCSDFYIWLAKGLVGRRHTLKLESSKEHFNNVGLGFFFKNIFFILQSKVEKQINEIGLKGFVGQIKNLFSNDDSSLDRVRKERIRQPMAFFGKFKYFKSYVQQDAYLINNFFGKYPLLKNKYYPVSIVMGFKSFYLFTTISLILVNISTFEIVWIIDYYSIKKVECEKNVLNVTYNQVIDNNSGCKVNCENDDIAGKVAKQLNEEAINNRENILEV